MAHLIFMTNSIMWFRFDLRVNDNEAFYKASLNENCLPLFILDSNYLKSDTTSSFHLKFLDDSLNNLSQNLSKLGAKLNFYEGNTIEIFKKIFEGYKVSKIYSHRIFKNFFFRDLDNEFAKFIQSKNGSNSTNLVFRLRKDRDISGQTIGINLLKVRFTIFL